MKPDCLLRSLLGEIIHRFERKGLRIVGLKMAHLDLAKLEEHYFHHKDKPFFPAVAKYMMSSPVVLMALSGMNAIEAARLITGERKGHSAAAGTIRGDFSLSGTMTIVHASDTVENGEAEVKRFFTEKELFEYNKLEFGYQYGAQELE